MRLIAVHRAVVHPEWTQYLAKELHVAVLRLVRVVRGTLVVEHLEIRGLVHLELVVLVPTSFLDLLLEARRDLFEVLVLLLEIDDLGVVGFGAGQERLERDVVEPTAHGHVLVQRDHVVVGNQSGAEFGVEVSVFIENRDVLDRRLKDGSNRHVPAPWIPR